MRRLILVGLLLLLTVPSAASALRRAPGDGTLAVRNGNGYLVLSRFDGVVIGKLDGGVLDVRSTEISDCSELSVWGADGDPVDRTIERVDGTIVTRCVFREFLVAGTREAMRFRLVLKDAILVVRRGSIGLSLSAIGRGRGYIEGAGGFFDGMYSVNGESFASLPDDGSRFFLGATLP